MMSSASNFLAVFELAADLLFVARRDGRILMANRAFRQKLKLTDAQVADVHLQELLACPDWLEVQSKLSSDAVEMSEFEWRSTDGQSLRLRGKFYLDETSGNCCGQFRSAELPEPKTTFDGHETASPNSGAEQTLSAVLSAVPDALLVLDQDGFYRHVFTGDQQMLVADDLIGKNLTDVMSQEEAEVGLQTIAEVLESNSLVKLEHPLTIRGVQRWFSGRVVPFGEANGESNEACVLWSSTDITEKVLARTQVRRENARMNGLLELGERERVAIAGEIHDSFVQHSVGAQMWLQAVKEAAGAEFEASEALQIVEQSLQESIREARSIISQLRPLVIPTEDIEVALDRLAFETARQFSAECRLDIVNVPHDVPAQFANLVVRIVQAALRRSFQRARATEVKLTALVEADELVVTVYDNGQEFVGDEAEPLLDGIRTRCGVYGGSFTVSYRADEGNMSVARLQIPSVQETADDDAS